MAFVELRRYSKTTSPPLAPSMNRDAQAKTKANKSRVRRHGTVGDSCCGSSSAEGEAEAQAEGSLQRVPGSCAAHGGVTCDAQDMAAGQACGGREGPRPFVSQGQCGVAAEAAEMVRCSGWRGPGQAMCGQHACMDLDRQDVGGQKHKARHTT
eukprot:363402-Chlamydomonas_euryale.AAC.4